MGTMEQEEKNNHLKKSGDDSFDSSERERERGRVQAKEEEGGKGAMKIHFPFLL